MPNLAYTISAYTPFTKILSASVNQDKTDIQNRINWAGGTDATTGLGDSNIQSNAVSGGGLTRSTKLKLGTAKAFISNDSTGAMQDVVSAANQTLYTDNSGNPTAGQLPTKAGGTGQSIDTTTNLPGDVFQVDANHNVVVTAPPTPAASRIFNYYRFS